MSLLVVGSVAFDSIETPTAVRDKVIGGSAVYFSYAASYFTPVQLVGVVGEDWAADHTRMLQARGIDTAGLQVVPGAKTFHWRGKYLPNMNDRETLEVQLNVFGDFDPRLPPAYRQAEAVFLANGAPGVQLQVLAQVERPRLVFADTMDLWIREQREGLVALLRRVDGLVLNDSEARLLTGEENVVRAGRRVGEFGPRFVVVKKGEHGVMCFSPGGVISLPAFPTEQVIDPTGAGDSFAGGMMGFLAEQRDYQLRRIKEALAYGSLVASFNVEDFSLGRMQAIERPDLDERMRQYRDMLTF